MTGTLVSIIAILTAFIVVVVYNYISDLRRDLRSARDEAQTAWRLYDNTNRELCATQGKPVPASFFPEPQKNEKLKDPGFRVGTVGVTAINDRERRRERADHELRRGPSPADIAAAAREAVNGDGLE